MKFVGEGFQQLQREQDRQTDKQKQTDVAERITIRIRGW